MLNPPHVRSEQPGPAPDQALRAEARSDPRRRRQALQRAGHPRHLARRRLGQRRVDDELDHLYRRKEDLAAACFLAKIAWLDALIAEAEAAPTGGAPAPVPRPLLPRARRHGDGGRPALIRFHDVRALPSPQAETVFSAYNAFFRRMRALCLEADAVAGLDRNARNTRTHLLVSVVQTMRVWIDRYEPDDYPRVGARVADLVLNGLAAPGSAWPPRLDLALPAPEWAPTDAFLRAATILINEQGYRGASVEKISAHLRVTKGSFYHHNDNKDDLVANCFARTFERIRRTQDAAEAAGGTGWERLGAATATLVAHQLSEAGPLLRWIAVGPCRTGCGRT